MSLGTGGEGARLMILLQLGLGENRDINPGCIFLLSLPWAGNPLAAALADEEAVAGAPHVLPAWGGVADGGGLVAGGAFHNMLYMSS